MFRIIFELGPVRIYSYGFFVALAFLMATVLVVRDAKRSGIDPSGVLDCMIAILAAGLLGGRLLHVILNWSYYSHFPRDIIMMQEGGLAVQGGILFGAIAGVITAKVKKLPVWGTTDLIIPYVALGQAIGRIGCLLNGCCYGRRVVEGIGITFPGEDFSRFPTQVYSSVILMGIFVLLLVLRDRKKFDGFIFSLYLIIYSIFRFFMDFFRGDELTRLGDITLSQGISLGLFALGLVLYVLLKRKNPLKR